MMSSRGRGKGGKRQFRQGKLDEDMHVLNIRPHNLLGVGWSSEALGPMGIEGGFVREWWGPNTSRRSKGRDLEFPKSEQKYKADVTGMRKRHGETSTLVPLAP